MSVQLKQTITKPFLATSQIYVNETNVELQQAQKGDVHYKKAKGYSLQIQNNCCAEATFTDCWDYGTEQNGRCWIKQKCCVQFPYSVIN